MTVDLSICDIPLFRRIAVNRIQPFSRTYYEMDNGLYTQDITRARLFTQGNIKFHKYLRERGYGVGDREFQNRDSAIEYSMTMLVLDYGFRDFSAGVKNKNANK